MNNNQLIQNNIENLTNLFKVMGGVHLVGVSKEHRAQGMAENIMKRAINLSKEKNIDIMVFQASLLGLGIYQRLGFKQNFMLRNYQK